MPTRSQVEAASRRFLPFPPVPLGTGLIKSDIGFFADFVTLPR